MANDVNCCFTLGAIRSQVECVISFPLKGKRNYFLLHCSSVAKNIFVKTFSSLSHLIRRLRLEHNGYSLEFSFYSYYTENKKHFAFLGDNQVGQL